MAYSSKKITPKINNEGANVVAMGRSITGRVTLTLISGVVLTLVTVIGAIIWMANAQNQQAVEATKTMVEGGIVATEESTKALTNDYGWWQDAYDSFVARDDEWIEDNIGASVYDTLTSDSAAIITPEGDVIYSWVLEGYGFSPSDLYTDYIAESLVGLIYDAPLESLIAQAAYVVVDGQVVLLAAAHLAPIQHLEGVDSTTLPTIVMGFVLTEDFFIELGETFLIDDLHLVQGDEAQIDEYKNFPELRDIDDEFIGRLVWTPPTPGTAVLKTVVLPIGMALFLFVLIVLVTVAGTRRISQALTKSTEDLQKSESKLEKQLVVVASEKERVETIVESIGEGILVADSKGNVMMANKAASDILGKSEKKLIGMQFKNAFNVKGAQKDSPFAPILDSLKKKSAVKVDEANFIRDDGEGVTLALTSSPVEIGGEVIGGIVVFHDVTEQKLVALAKDKFISTAAHQLRTPLTGLAWGLQVLLEEAAGKLNDKQIEFVRKSSEGANRLSVLVNNLLNVDKYATKEEEMVIESTDVGTLVDGVVSDLKQLADSKGVEVEVSKADDLSLLPVDVSLMQVVLQNLIDNAIKYSHRGGKVQVEVKEDGNNVIVSVIDQGIGIPRNQQKSIFTRFFRASNAVPFETSGSGLGLFMSQQIVDSHNGSLTFESVLDKGTTFHLELPKDQSNNKKKK